MPKRLTATEKWNDPWFCGLNIEDKLFWIYLCDNCDHAGIYKWDKEDVFNKIIMGRVQHSEEKWINREGESVITKKGKIVEIEKITLSEPKEE